MKLTASIIETLTCPTGKRDITYFDSALPGFGLRCRSSGVRRWVVQYEHNGLTRRITLGPPEVFGLDEARRIARTKVAEVRLGGDPAAKKIEERKAAKHTLVAVIEEYLSQRQTRLRQSSMDHMGHYLRDWWKPLHGMPIHRITRRDIAPFLNGPAVASARARSRLMACCRWAIEQGYLDANPVIGTSVPDKHIKPRERVLSAQEIVAIWNACDGRYAYNVIVRLLIVTAARRG
jgi:integrase